MSDKKLQSVYAKHILNFIEFKNQSGIEYRTRIFMLRDIDKLATESNEKGPGLTKSFCDRWLNSRPNQSQITRYEWCRVLREFASYMINLGVNSYLPILPRHLKSHFSPYIYSKNEIDLILEASNNLKTSSPMHTGLFSFPAVIRFIYATGARIGEALALQLTDLYLDDKFVIINDSKSRHQRMIPISDTLIEVLKNYLWHRSLLNNPETSNYVFVKTNGLKSTQAIVREYFQRCLKIAAIFGDDYFKKPRVHDLRHTFAVNSLIKIVESGNDVMVFLPILSKYLGHSSITATNSYVRLTASMYPQIIKDIDLYLLNVFPKNEDDEIQ